MRAKLMGWFLLGLIRLLTGAQREFDPHRALAASQHALGDHRHHRGQQLRLGVGHGRHGDGVMLALAAIRWDPLRESATRALVEAHLAQGNLADAGRAYAQYATSLAAELGAEPHPDFAQAQPFGA